MSLSSRHTSENISTSEFERLLLLYGSIIPEKITLLDEARYREIPKALSDRTAAKSPSLEKPELLRLAEWKFKHGTFRPLLKKISSNSAEEVRRITSEAFAKYSEGSHERKKALDILTELQGIGPATASLILSCYDPLNIPFFSDEMFRWLLWAEGRGNGWDRKIRYSFKEYEHMCGSVEKLKSRLSAQAGHVVSAAQIEQVAYTLAKTANNTGEKSVQKRKASDTDNVVGEQGEQQLRRSRRR